MITTKKMIVGLGAVSLAVLIALPAFVSAASVVNVSVNLSNVVSTGDQSIAMRLTDLTALNAKVQAMTNVSASVKASTSANIQNQINSLTALKAKLDADTDVTIARTDAASVFGSYRIYALVIPQGYLLVSADRINTIGTLMTALSTKLQGRAATASLAGGTNVSGNPKIFADITAKIADANAHATLAANGILFLSPDNGNLTIATSNKGALVASRANIAVATADLKQARADIQSLMQNLDISVNASASTQASQ